MPPCGQQTVLMKTDSACILTVDDEPVILTLLRQVLEQEGHKVLEAETGQAAFASAKKEQPDLILLDINLPDISGFDICRQLFLFCHQWKEPIFGKGKVVAD